MNIPIEVVRKGLTEEYVELAEARREVRSTLYRNSREYNEVLSSVYGLSHNYDPYYYENIGPAKTDETGRHTAASRKLYETWTHALLVEETAKRLPEIAGRIKDAQKELTEIANKINRMEATGNYDG